VKPITLNLASRPFRNNTAVAALLAGASLALVLATAYNLYVYLNYGSSYAQLQEGEQQERARLAALEAEERTLLKEVQQRDFRRIYERGKFANDLILKRSFSWTLLFNTLEVVIPPDVMMRSIRPNITAEGISIRVEGIAKGHGAFLTLEDKLIGHPAFARVFPVNERRLNPSRPEIDFALHFDYLPQQAVPKDLVAESAAGASAGSDAVPASAPASEALSPAGSGPAVSAPAAPDPGAPAPAAVGQVATGSSVAADSPTKLPERPRFDMAAALTSVGRDGKRRTPETLARTLIAPGGVYLPSSGFAGGQAEKGAPGRKGAKAGSPGEGPRSRHGKADRTVEEAGGAGSQGTLAGPRAGALGPAAAHAAPAPGAPPRARSVSASGSAAGPAHVEKTVVPAQRLDIPMSFVAQPVGEVYQSLARAHGVTFDIDAGVDQMKKVSADLSGKELTQAVLIVAGLAGHRVRREADRVYHIAIGSGAASISEPVVGEEDLQPAKVAP
jgi:hypothetical protein